MNALNLTGDKCKIMFFDDSAKKEGYNVVVNMGGGPKMVARAKKGEKLKNFFQRLNLNVINMFFVKNANIVDPEQRVSVLANKQDKIDKSLQVVGIQNNENNDERIILMKIITKKIMIKIKIMIIITLMKNCLIFLRKN